LPDPPKKRYAVAATAKRSARMREYFESAGFTPGQCNLSLAHIISRAVHPASEHATVDWLNDNSVHCAN